MKLLLIASLFLLCGMAVGKAQPPQKGSTKAGEEGVPTTIRRECRCHTSVPQYNFLTMAEAMPADKYSFIPSAGNFDGVRSFAEQVKHVACAQLAFFSEFEGKIPPADCERGGNNPAKTKAELIKYLKDSFDYANRAVATLDEKNALDRAEGRYAAPNTKLGVSVAAVWHVTDHYGQLVEYLRMNGIIPPMTQKHGLKVR